MLVLNMFYFVFVRYLTKVNLILIYFLQNQRTAIIYENILYQSLPLHLSYLCSIINEHHKHYHVYTTNIPDKCCCRFPLAMYS